jgi:putative transposase
MSGKLARRLDGSAYVGLRRYFVTICTFHRVDAFREDPVVEHVMMQFRQRAVDHQFAIHAYCFMPDHVHLVLEGLSDLSDLRRFVRDWKQRTAFEYRRTTGSDLWQRGYFDYVLRADEDTDIVARSVLTNPVRAGLVGDVRDYRYVGSDTSTIDDLLLRAAEVERGRRNRQFVI